MLKFRVLGTSALAGIVLLALHWFISSAVFFLLHPNAEPAERMAFFTQIWHFCHSTHPIHPAELIYVIPVWMILGVFSARHFISRVTGNYLHNPKKWHQDCFRDWLSVVFPPFGILLILLFFALLSGISGLAVGIPAAGPILFVFLLPFLVLFALIMAVTILAGLLGLVQGPGIAAVWQEDAFSILFQYYAMIFESPLKRLSYTLLNILYALLVFFISALMIMFIFSILKFILGTPWLLGREFSMAVDAAFFHFCPLLYRSEGTINHFFPWLYGSLLFLKLVSAGYAAAVFHAGQTAAFMNIKFSQKEIDLIKLNTEKTHA